MNQGQLREWAWEYEDANDYFRALDNKYHALEHALNALSNDDGYLAWYGIMRLNTVCSEYVDSSHGDYYATHTLFMQHLMEALEKSSAALANKLAFIINALAEPLEINDSFLDALDKKAPTLSLALHQALQSDTYIAQLPSEIASTLCHDGRGHQQSGVSRRGNADRSI